MVWWASGANLLAGDMGIGMRSSPNLSPRSRCPTLPAEWPAVDSAQDVGLDFQFPLSLHTLAQEIAACLPKEPIVTAALDWDPHGGRCQFRLSQYELGDLGVIWLEENLSSAGTKLWITGAPIPGHDDGNGQLPRGRLYERRRRHLARVLGELLTSLLPDPLVRSLLANDVTSQRLIAKADPIRNISLVIRRPSKAASDHISGKIHALLADGLEDLGVLLGRIHIAVGMNIPDSEGDALLYEVAGYLVERTDGWNPGRRLSTGTLLRLRLEPLGSSMTLLEGSCSQPRFLQQNPTIDPEANAYLDTLGYVAMVDLAFMELVSSLKGLGDEIPARVLSPRNSSPAGRHRHPENEWAREEVHGRGRQPAEVYVEWLAKRSAFAAQGLRPDLADPWESFKFLLRTPPLSPSG